MKRRIVIAVIASFALVLVGAGCGGGDDEAEPQQPAATETATETEAETGTTETGMEGATIQLAADPGGAFEFDRDSLEASAGMVMIELTNDASIPHNVAVEGNGVNEESETVTGDTTTLMVELEPGTYTFYCSVPGHREGGMEGTLTVT